MTGATVGAQTVQYQYDDGGHRIQQTAGTQTTNYLWDQLSPYGDVIQEADGTGAPIASYVLGGAELLTQTRGATTNYYLHDGQNSVRTLTDVTGNATDQYTYEAFGATRNQTGTTVNSYQYTGQQNDSLTGLYDLRARYYDPGVGRFASQDSLSAILYSPTQHNRYTYVANNPVNLVDLSGQIDSAVADLVTAFAEDSTTGFGQGVELETQYSYDVFADFIDELQFDDPVPNPTPEVEPDPELEPNPVPVPPIAPPDSQNCPVTVREIFQNPSILAGFNDQEVSCAFQLPNSAPGIWSTMPSSRGISGGTKFALGIGALQVRYSTGLSRRHFPSGGYWEISIANGHTVGLPDRLWISPDGTLYDVAPVRQKDNTYLPGHKWTGTSLRPLPLNLEILAFGGI